MRLLAHIGAVAIVLLLSVVAAYIFLVAWVPADAEGTQDYRDIKYG